MMATLRNNFAQNAIAQTLCAPELKVVRPNKVAAERLLETKLCFKPTASMPMALGS